jgi:2-oxoglutarate dehydrogenase complex dehydrogenase (E1) component-like enzyme
LRCHLYLQELIDAAADGGVESVVIGMPHRGRLNVLGNVVRKPLRHILSEFGAGIKPVGEAGTYTGSGDVKYHLGTSFDRSTRSGKKVHVSLVANPSHLEAVAPVVIGKTRAKQYYSNDKQRLKHMAVIMHGDGSFSGQGVVYETLHLSDLPNYCTGGSIHIVVNNQVCTNGNIAALSFHSKLCNVVCSSDTYFLYFIYFIDLLCFRLLSQQIPNSVAPLLTVLMWPKHYVPQYSM